MVVASAHMVTEMFAPFAAYKRVVGTYGRVLAAYGRALGAYARALGPHGRSLAAHSQVPLAHMATLGPPSRNLRSPCIIRIIIISGPIGILRCWTPGRQDFDWFDSCL